MESMDIDMVIDIPDTPDRISAKRRQAAGKEHVSSSSSCSRNFCLFDEDHSNKMGDSERITSNRSLLGRTNSTGELDNRNGVQPSGKAPLFRRTAGEKDKGKAICTKFPLKLSGAQRPLKVAGKDDKGKGKLNDETEKERIILSSPSPPKNDDCILSFDRPILRAPQRRRLVKNGCISPHGIAARAKRPAEDIQSSSKDDLPEQHCTRKATFSNPSPVDIQEIVKEDDASDEAKGKRAITRRHFSKDSEIQIIGVDETRDRRGETSGSGGQSSTDSRQTRIDRPCPSRNKLCLILSAPTTSSLSAETNPKSERSQINNRAIKRRRSNEFNSAASDEPGTSLYGTSGESHRSRLSNFQNRQNGAMLHQVLGTDTSPGGFDGTGSVENHESEARARQLEADEWLARELQEQLDQDASIFDHEIDERIAWALQQQENSRRASSSRNNHPRPRSSSVSSLRQARAQLQQNSLNRRANIPRANSSVRTARSRGNPSGRSIARIPRNLNFRFPTGMAIESRVDMLEVLEAAAEELNGSMNRTSRLLQFDGEFNEQHYEMLLALDEDNHQHGGASVNLVNSLPQSTVKTDSFEEACAICLDTPARGDVIRHLPCLHKFHKDCIDPWLGRSKSCPVCKSLIS